MWLHLQKECLVGPHRKLHPLRYGPYTITKAVGDNSFELSIPPFLVLHPVFNVDLLWPYFPPLMDTSNVVEQLTPTELNPKTAWNKPQPIGLWTHRSRTPVNRRCSYIELLKQANSFTRESGSPRTKFNKSFLISWRNSVQWGQLLPKGRGMIQEDIGCHPPIPLRPPPLFLSVFQFP